MSPHLLLFAASLLIQPSRVDAASGQDSWYTYDHEHDFVEVVVLVALLLTALAFDIAFHTISHMSRLSYRYGVLHEAAYDHSDEGDKDGYGNVRHVRLMEELTRRTGGEFMTLGFLAFCIFVFNNSGGFDLLVANFPGSQTTSMPSVALDWLHVAEIAHMQLFVGMVLYFFLMWRTIHGSAQMIQTWEKIRLQQVRSIMQGSSNHLQDAADPDWASFRNMQEYFLMKVPDWRRRKPKLFQEALQLFEIEHDGPEPVAELLQEIDQRFSFSAYLALGVEHGVQDSIEIHRLTWICVIVLFIFSATLHRYGSMSFTSISHVFVGTVFVILLGMRFIAKRRQDRISVAVKARPDWRADGSINRNVSEGSQVTETPDLEPYNDWRGAIPQFNWGKVIMRSLQVVLFMISYVFARSLGNVDGWKSKPKDVLLVVALFSLLFAMLSHWLPHQLPKFLALMSLPPFITDRNIVHFFAALLDDHAPFLQKAKEQRCESGSSGSRYSRKGSFAFFTSPDCVGGACGELREEIQALETRLRVLEQKAMRQQRSPLTPSEVEEDDAVAHV